jgi:hypothetical protein
MPLILFCFHISFRYQYSVWKCRYIHWCHSIAIIYEILSSINMV